MLLENNLKNDNHIKFKLPEKHINLVFLLMFVFSFITYIGLLFDVILFKYVSLSDIFIEDRFRVQEINYIPFSDWYVDRSGLYRDVILNVILFFPFGFLLQMTSKRNRICVYPMVIPFIASIFVEMLQFIFSLGVTDITDVISNTSGAIFGCLFYLIFSAVFKKRRDKASKILLLVITIIALLILALML